MFLLLEGNSADQLPRGVCQHHERHQIALINGKRLCANGFYSSYVISSYRTTKRHHREKLHKTRALTFAFAAPYA